MRESIFLAQYSGRSVFADRGPGEGVHGRREGEEERWERGRGARRERRRERTREQDGRQDKGARKERENGKTGQEYRSVGMQMGSREGRTGQQKVGRS